MSGIIGSKLNIRGSGRIAKLGTDGQVLTSSGAGVAAAFEDVAGGTSWQSVETGATFTAVAGNGYPVNTTAQACTVTLPAGSVGDIIELVDYAGTWDTNKVILTANGSEKIKGSTNNAELTAERQGIKIVYVDATQGWVAITGVNDDTAPALNPPSYDIEYVLVAGGGGGGSGNAMHTCGAGGGAGGFRNSFSSENTGGGCSGETPITTFVGGPVFTLTIGTGGAGSAVGAGGVNGVDSSISGTGGFSTLTATGGGRGGSGKSGVTHNAQNGGSGGGSQQYNSDTPGTGVSCQGYAGGTGDGGDASGGGGGASEVGYDRSVTTSGAGGDGVSSSITGGAITYAGGGGAGGYDTNTPGAGGAGGGGDGNNGTTAGDAGTDELGGGGGGGGANSGGGGVGGDGGDGVILLRMLTAKFTGTVTGSPDEDTDGSYTILKYTGDGTYTS